MIDIRDQGMQITVAISYFANPFIYSSNNEIQSLVIIW